MRRVAFLAICVFALSPVVNAGVLYFNGFEAGQPGANDFSESSSFPPAPGSDITVVSSGGGTLGLTAPGGTHYAEIVNNDDTYFPGYGTSVYTGYGDLLNGLPISGAFYEQTAYYINTAWAPAGPDANYAGFWIDSTPLGDPGFLDETNFRIIAPPGGPISVDAFAGNPGTSGTVTDISTSGWYTFKTTFQDDGGFVENVMSVIDPLGTTIGSFTGLSTLPFADLAGVDYGDWTTVWQDGFAGDTLGIDNVEVGTISGVPLPSSCGAGALLMVGVAAWQVSRRRANRA